MSKKLATIFMFSLIIFVFVLGEVKSMESFQRRSIYYSDQDNVCNGGPSQNDKIFLNIRIDGTKVLKKQVWGWSTCEENFLEPVNRISPPISWVYYDRTEGNRIVFKEEFIKGQLRDRVLMMVLETSIPNPKSSIISGKPYQCNILGDEQVQHFGVTNPSFPPCQYFIQCKRLLDSEIADLMEIK